MRIPRKTLVQSSLLIEKWLAWKIGNGEQVRVGCKNEHESTERQLKVVQYRRIVQTWTPSDVICGL